MLSYIFRRLILIVPTLVGIMCINFFLVQFVPGGPIEQIISDLEKNSSFLDSIGGGSQEVRQAMDLSRIKVRLGCQKILLMNWKHNLVLISHFGNGFFQ